MSLCFCGGLWDDVVCVFVGLIEVFHFLLDVDLYIYVLLGLLGFGHRVRFVLFVLLICCG